MEMKTEALALADYLDNNVEAMLFTEQPHLDRASMMIRRLVEELDKHKEIDGVFDYYCDENIRSKQTKPLSDEEIIAIRDSCYVQSGIDEWEFDDIVFARAIEKEHGIK